MKERKKKRERKERKKEEERKRKVVAGLGRLTVDAILRRDYPVIQGVVLLFSFVYVLVNLLIDLLYTLIDPRIRY